MDLSSYFEPINLESIVGISNNGKTLLNNVKAFTPGEPFPELKKGHMAIVGVCEDRLSPNNHGCSLAPDAIRERLYRLAPPDLNLEFYDLGNIQAGNDPSDTLFAVTEVVYKLVERGLTVLILGGSQAITYANYKAYDILGRIVDIVDIDSRFDIEQCFDLPTSDSYVNKIIMEQPNFLFNLTYLGYQSYFSTPDMIQLVDELCFDAYRLGVIQNGMDKAEPHMRGADIVSIDISAVRQSDAPGNSDPSPHGFYGEELCHLTRYAGLSSKLSSIGFYEYNPRFDNHKQTAHLLAHAIWYFMEGFVKRIEDNPFQNRDDFQRYIVDMSESDMQIIFHRSKKTGRWWFEIPYEGDNESQYRRQLTIPCLYEDYLQALENQIPENWWKYYKRVHK